MRDIHKIGIITAATIFLLAAISNWVEQKYKLEVIKEVSKAGCAEQVFQRILEERGL